MLTCINATDKSILSVEIAIARTNFCPPFLGTVKSKQVCVSIVGINVNSVQEVSALWYVGPVINLELWGHIPDARNAESVKINLDIWYITYTKPEITLLVNITKIVVLAISGSR